MTKKKVGNDNANCFFFLLSYSMIYQVQDLIAYLMSIVSISGLKLLILYLLPYLNIDFIIQKVFLLRILLD